MKNIKVDFFSESKKWPRRMPKIKTITKKTINKMLSYFKKDPIFDLNLRLGEGSGAAIASLILKSAIVTHNGMSTFSDAHVTNKNAS